MIHDRALNWIGASSPTVRGGRGASSMLSGKCCDALPYGRATPPSFEIIKRVDTLHFHMLAYG